MYLGLGLAPNSAAVFAVIVLGNLLTAGTAATLSSLVSTAASARQQGEAMGAVASVQSLMGVLAPVIGPSLLGLVSARPQGDAMLGLPLYFSALLQVAALVLAIQYFRRRPAPLAAASA
jgi:DHA1 family tetracycline resistance protein-like MFS transporter